MRSGPTSRNGGRLRRFGRTTALVAACLVAQGAPDASGQNPRRPRVDVPRSPPPQGTWDRVTAETFLPDAFATLQGTRPAFGAGPRRAVDPAATGGSAEPTSAGGFAWSALVSEDTLTDEVKDAKAGLAAACAKPTDFKGGGFEEARVRFSALALAFGVIAAYDQDVRWKKDAAVARDLFARAGFNCKVGTDQSLSESKARAADLVALLEGNGLPSRSERDPDSGDPIWSQVAARPALMKRLERADAVVGAAVASRTEFTRAAAQLLHEVEMAAAIAEVIQRKDYEYHDDETYRGYAAAMREAALKARAAAAKDDYDGVRAAAGDLKKSCDACHGDYRS